MSAQRKIEQWYPYAAAAVSAPAWFYLFRWLNLSTHEAKDLFSVVLNVSAIAAGFLGTAASILLTMGATPVIKDLKGAGTMRLLYRYVISAIWHQFWLVFLSVGLLMLYPKLSHPRLLTVLAVAWGISTSLAVLSNIRIIRLFGKIITAE
jgi:hypothetical protein